VHSDNGKSIIKLLVGSKKPEAFPSKPAICRPGFFINPTLWMKRGSNQKAGSKHSSNCAKGEKPALVIVLKYC
jgi:hypothetical protein